MNLYVIYSPMEEMYFIKMYFLHLQFLQTHYFHISFFELNSQIKNVYFNYLILISEKLTLLLI